MARSPLPLTPGRGGAGPEAGPEAGLEALPPAMAAEAGPEGEQPPPASLPRLSGGAAARAAGAMLQFLVRLRGAAPPPWHGTAGRAGGAAARPREEGRGVRPLRGPVSGHTTAPCPATPRPLSAGQLRPALAPRQRPILGRLPPRATSLLLPTHCAGLVPLVAAERCLQAAPKMEFHGLFFLHVMLLICLGDSAGSRRCSPCCSNFFV